MKQKWRNPEGHWVDVGDRDDVAELLGKNSAWGQTFAKYSRMGWPKTNPAPKPVSVDPATRRDLFVLSECRAWEMRRLGPGQRVTQ